MKLSISVVIGSYSSEYS